MAKNTLSVTVNRLVAAKEEEIRHHCRQFMLDLVTIALGRMGYCEKRLADFEKALSKVAEEYGTIILDDVKDDADLDYSKSKLDEELRQYCGDKFCCYEERYAL